MDCIGSLDGKELAKILGGDNFQCKYGEWAEPVVSRVLEGGLLDPGLVLRKLVGGDPNFAEYFLNRPSVAGNQKSLRLIFKILSQKGKQRPRKIRVVRNLGRQPFLARVGLNWVVSPDSILV